MITFLELGNYGRLGNMMFQVASTIGVASENGHLSCFPEWEHPFKHQTRLLDPADKFEKIEVPWGYHPLEIEGDRKVSLHGYLQSEKYFINYEAGIRNLFTFKTLPDKKHYIAHGDFIAVHVRRGDYDPRYHTLLLSDYYREAIRRLPDLPIMLFSDDMHEAQKVVPWHTNTFHSPNAGYDLAMMTLAKFHIISNSSFAWWGAWLGNSERVIAPGDWFGPLSPYDTKDLIPDRWEVI
jgi:hypothetical protein